MKKITVNGHDLELVNVNVTPSGYGHKMLDVVLSKNGVEQNFKSTTDNMPDFDRANELDGEERNFALFNIVKYSITNAIDEWAMEQDKELLKLNVKMYNSNAEVFFSKDSESFGSLNINTEFLGEEYDDEEEAEKLEIEGIESKIKDFAEDILDRENLKFDQDSYNDVISTFRIHFSARISDYFSSKNQNQL
jgi:hypothetical protein